jgi:hypothetical protein
VRPGAAAGDQQTVFPHAHHHLTGRAKLVKTAEHGGDRFSHRFAAVHHHPAVRVIIETDRPELAQLSFSGFMAQSGGQALPDHVKLGLSHGALKTQDQAIVEVGRMIQAVAVSDQCVGQRVQVQQLILAALLRAQRDTSMPRMIPALPSPTSTTSFSKPFLVDVSAPDWPKSSSMITTWRGAQPSVMARSASSYWRSRLSVFSRT